MDPLYDVYYEKYCLLHTLYGADRRHLERQEYEDMDRELLALIERAQHTDLGDVDVARIRELEYLLLDDVTEGFYS